jgi:hypothetical protein
MHMTARVGRALSPQWRIGGGNFRPLRLLIAFHSIVGDGDAQEPLFDGETDRAAFAPEKDASCAHCRAFPRNQQRVIYRRRARRV